MRVLIIGTVWPEPDSSAAGSRMMQLIRLFREAGSEVTFASAAERSAHSKPTGVVEVPIKMNDSSFDTFIKDLNPDVVVFDRFMTEEQFGWRVEDICPQALRLLNTEDLHSLRSMRKQAVKAEKEFSLNDYLANELTIRELSAIYRCDCTILISTFERDFLLKKLSIPENLLVYLPLLVGEIDVNTPDFNNRKGFVTIGNFRHAPNADSVRFMKSHIWPIIRQNLTDANFHVYGSYMGPEFKKLHDPKVGFFMHGRAESSAEVIKHARVCLAYLRFGAGLKGKVFESMQYGMPVLTTSIGAEGLFTESEAPGFVSDNPQEFAEMACKLYKDESVWNQKSKKGIEILQRDFIFKTHKAAFIKQLASLIDNLEGYRASNITGTMLRYHLHRSTRFMSKWIEEKNRKKG